MSSQTTFIHRIGEITVRQKRQSRLTWVTDVIIHDKDGKLSHQFHFFSPTCVDVKVEDCSEEE